MWVKILLFILIKTLVCEEIEESEPEDLRIKKDGFLFSMPKTLHNGRNETVCLSLHSAKLPAKAIINLRWKEKYFSTLKTLRTDRECFHLHVPHLPINEPQLVSVKVQIQINGQIQTAHNQDLILIYPNKSSKTFIETDRGIYKPGDEVKIRILTLTDKLLPEENMSVDVKLKNPLDVTVAVWENEKLVMGLSQFSYELVAESMPGKWKIETNGETATFEVQKYVLPKFKVDLFYPKLIYCENDKVPIRVCAKYSYNKSVSGMVVIKVIDSHSNMQTLYKDNRLASNGCTDFTLTNQELNLDHVKRLYTMYDPRIHIHITATVAEQGTDRIQIAMVKSLVSLKPYNIRFVADPMFQPGMFYKGKLQLSNILVDTKSHVFEICYNVAIRKSWNYLNNEQCSNFTVQENKTSIEFNILPLKNNIIHIHLNARSLNHTNIGDSFLAVRLYSPSNNYIYLDHEPMENSLCNKDQQLTVHFTRDKFLDNENVTFYYMIRSLQHIQELKKYVHTVQKQPYLSYHGINNLVGTKHRFVKYGIQIDHFKLNFKIRNPIITSYHILVYYVTKTGETVAATRNVMIEPCLKNKVQASWLKSKIHPGSSATLKINASSDSLCAISSVDKAVNFMDTPRYSLNDRNLVKPFIKENDAAESGRKTCITPTKKITKPSSLTKFEEESFMDLRRRKRHIYSFSEDFDAYDIFNKFGTITITNLRVITKSCYTGPLINSNGSVQYMILTSDYNEENEESYLPIRSYFPETWLWDLVHVKKHENLEIERTLPHSITNWMTHVMCVSPSEGVGFSKDTEISAFQPFFVDVVIPYSLKRDETFYLHINVFNYLNYSLPINVKVEFSNHLELMLSPKNPNTISFCVQKFNTTSHIFTLKTLRTGSANITVTAEIDTDFPTKCGPESVVNKKDVVSRAVIIEPEGYPMSVTKSALLCGSDNAATNLTWDLTKPDDVVPGTNKAYITINGDILGHTIENIDQLLTMPTGCGEQIMASMAPNLYAMRYLQATNKLTSTLRQKITRNLKIGYQRILNYAHKDGSFSAFGYYDPSGSMFLTAFVIRTLQEAKQYIYVDQRVIDKAVQWIFDHQLENGCFNAMLHVFQDMGGASTENSTASLTAYVVISLEEAKIDIPLDVKRNAKYCLRGYYNPEKYTLAISCYTLFKVNWLSEAHRMLNRLISMAHQQQNMMWWTLSDGSESTATDIEITGYVLLSLLQRNSSDDLAHAHDVVRWLTSKQNNHGGFKTTQDTVVVLDALSKYATLVNHNPLNIKLYIKENTEQTKVIVKKNDKLKSRKVQLKENTNKVMVEATGQGCVLIQRVMSYYLRHMKKSEIFKIDIEANPVSNADPCSVMSLQTCVAYLGPDVWANMAIIEIGLPSGYNADRASLYKLVDSEPTSKVKMFEEREDKIFLYLTRLDSQQICITFNINENNQVESRKDSLIKLYDYYKPEYQSVQFYRLNVSCQANSTSLPSLNSSESTTKKLIDYVDAIDTTKEENAISKPILDQNVNNVSKNDAEDIKGKKVKRHVITNKKPKELNPDFVDMDMEMATPNGIEGNRPVYMKPPKDMLPKSQKNTYNNNVKTRRKRQTNNGLNSNFINMDMEMATPKGMEGNVPVYVKPPKNMINQNFKNKSRRKRESKTLEQQKTKRNLLLRNTDARRQISFKVNSDDKNYNINTNFIDMDMEMATPDGMEGNEPVYIKLSEDLVKNMTRINSNAY